MTIVCLLELHMNINSTKLCSHSAMQTIIDLYTDNFPLMTATILQESNTSYPTQYVDNSTKDIVHSEA